jgi:hypothetical protein
MEYLRLAGDEVRARIMSARRQTFNPFSKQWTDLILKINARRSGCLLSGELLLLLMLCFVSRLRNSIAKCQQLATPRTPCGDLATGQSLHTF